MQKIKKFIPIGTGLMFTPLVAGAANVDDFFDVIGVVNTLLNTIIPLLIGVAVVVFLIGVIRYVTAGDDEVKIKAARSMMIYGIIGLFVMVSVWGLVNIIAGTFETNTSNIQVPGITPDTTSGGTIFR